jgi:class 3 adenylate cyclase/pimeloyl-ACP methyl ester carboxylesterase
MEPQIRFCTRLDGVRIAYATMGEGSPLIGPPGWISHVEQSIKDQAIYRFAEELARHHLFVTYDKHGTGLSDRNRTEFTLEAELYDLETVLEHLHLERVALLGISQAVPVCVAYAAKYPERVSHLILYGGYARGSAIATDDVKASMLSLIRAHWGMGSKALADVFMRGADAQTAEDFVKFQRAAATAETAAQLLDLCYRIDVSDLLGNVRAPTLVLHRDRDKAISPALGRELAALIPGAQFMPLEGRIHAPHLGDPDAVLRAVAEFLGDPVARKPTGASTTILGLSGKRDSTEVDDRASSTATILFADIADSTALQEKLGNVAFQERARTLEERVRDQIVAHSGVPVAGRTLGDGVLATFASASDAIAAALDCTAAGEEVGLALHLGLHAGDVMREAGNVYGQAVSIASRVSDLSAPNEVLVSGTVRDLARASAGVSFEDRGDHELKGVSEPVRVFAVRSGT